MKIVFFICAFLVGACNRSGSPATPGGDESGKTDGLPVATLTHEALGAALKECLKYGKMDDARVRYTPRYCSAVMSAHLSEGYAKPAKSNAESSINPLH